MTDQKKSFKFQTNIAETVEFRFDAPKTGKSEHGKWFLYGCVRNEEETAFFASNNLHNLIQHLNIAKSTIATITKKEYEDGNKNYWTIRIADIEYRSDEVGKTSKGQSPPPPPPVEKPDLEDLVVTLMTCYRSIKINADRTTENLTPENIQKLATAIFIEACRKGIFLKEGVARDVTDAPPENIDDLPF